MKWWESLKNGNKTRQETLGQASGSVETRP